MTTRVRIQRKGTKSLSALYFAWAHFFFMIARWWFKPWIDEEKEARAEAQMEVRRTQAAVNYARRMQIESRIGIQDEQLRKLQLQNELLERQVKLLCRADDFAPPSEW